MKITAYLLNENSATIEQLPMKRDWMDLTFDRHAYQCFPISLSNRLGWGISFPEDISFIWDGINDSTSDHVKILSGEKYAHPDRGNRTISFRTNIYFDSPKNVSLMTMPVPNQFIDGAQCMTTIISTSVLETEFQVAWMITRPNTVITIPAGTPVAAILPVSLTQIQSNEMIIRKNAPELWRTQSWMTRMSNRSKISMDMNSRGEWTHFYRDAIDPTGIAIGEHEAKKIIMKVSNYEQNN